jgi:transposase
MKLTDPRWKLSAPLFETAHRETKVGRPETPAREVLHGVLWILKTGARWKDLPREYPPYQTCHRRFQRWVCDGTMEKALRALAEDLRERGGIDLRAAFIDGTFSSAKKGVFVLARRNAAKGARAWQLRTLTVFLSRYALRALHRMK